MDSIETVAIVVSVRILRGITLAPGELVLAHAGGYIVDEQRQLITFYDTEHGLDGAIEFAREWQKC